MYIIKIQILKEEPSKIKYFVQCIKNQSRFQNAVVWLLAIQKNQTDMAKSMTFKLGSSLEMRMLLKTGF